MIALIVVIGGLAVFSVTQAFYWRVIARRAGAVDLLRSRLQLSSDDGFARARAQEDMLAVLLTQSGLTWTKSDFMRRLVAVAGVGGAIGAVRVGLEGGIVLGCLGAAGMYYYLIWCRDRRIQLVAAQMPRALELMNLTLRAGQSLQRSVEVVSEEMPAPTGIELKRVAEETALGRPIEESFAAMNRRLPGVAPLRALVTGIEVLGKTGGNLIEVLERVVDFSAQQSQFQQRLRALTAENRASGLILAMLPPGFALLTTIVSADYLTTLFTTALGRTMALTEFGFWLVGVIWIRRMAELED